MPKFIFLNIRNGKEMISVPLKPEHIELVKTTGFKFGATKLGLNLASNLLIGADDTLDLDTAIKLVKKIFHDNDLKGVYK